MEPDQQPTIGTGLAPFDVAFLADDPVAEIAVGQVLQQLVTVRPGELVVIDQSMKAIGFAAIPDGPDEGTLLEEFAVFFEEVIPQPIVQLVRRFQLARFEQSGQPSLTVSSPRTDGMQTMPSSSANESSASQL